MEGKVFDFSFGKVLRIVWFERHTVIAHPFRSMATHLRVSGTQDLPILLVETVVQGRLLDNFPRVLDEGGGSDRLRSGRYGLRRRWDTIQASWCRRAVGGETICVSVRKL